MATKLTLEGTVEMQAKIRRIRGVFPDELGSAMHTEYSIEAVECRRVTPVDTGALRSTIHVEGPEKNSRTVSVQVVAGGIEAPYAVVVHEDLDAFHPVGQAKYIEGPLNESAPFMANRIASRLDLRKMVG